MAKSVLCVDLGNVLIKFEERYLKEILREEKFRSFLPLIHNYDKGLIELFDLHKQLVCGNYFRRHISWAEFIGAYGKCIDCVHQPMYDVLYKIKSENRARLVCITDNNHFCFYTTSTKFPEVCELFREGEREQWILSYNRHSLKRDGGPFTRTPSEFGFLLKDACFVDDMQINLDMAVKSGFRKNACFLYNMKDFENHERFLKFLDKHFPAKS